ncbi:RNA polymerase sigma factor [compost metagenome]
MAELYDALKKLPPKAREIVELTYLEGYSNQEVADLLHISLQTVKNQKLRALSLLRKLLSRNSFHYLMSIVFFSSEI